VDDFKCGEQTFFGTGPNFSTAKGIVAAIDGNPNAANLQQRAAGISKAAKAYPGIKVIDIYYS